MQPADAIWYHLFPLGFLGAEPANPAPGAPGGEIEHRLRGLIPWLDHIAGLGATGLLLGPVLESETHGYDTVDYLRVDRRLGDEQDLTALIDAAHQHRLSVLLDGVFNHVGRGFWAFADVVERRSSSAYADWFRCQFDDESGGLRCATFEGHDHLVAFNHDNPEVLDLVTDVCRHWLDRGADGFRLDAAYAVPPRFWSDLGTRLRQTHPEVFLLGEVIHGDYVGFVERSGITTVTQYELWKAIWSSLNDANMFELSHALNRHRDFCQAFPPYTFVGNHDVTRIASQLQNPKHLAVAVAVLFTVPGIPSVYAGDEIGALGVKRNEVGGDDDIRKPILPHPPEAPLDDNATYRLYREMIGLRRANPWLGAGALVVDKTANQQLVYSVANGDRRLEVAIDLTADDPVRMSAG